MQYSARPWQDTNPVVTPLLQTHFLCHLPPESHTEQGVNAILKTPPADLLSPTLGCSRETLLPSDSPSLGLQDKEEEKEEAVLPCDCAGTPAVVRMPSHAAGFQHCGILPTGEQLSTIPPPRDTAELLNHSAVSHITTLILPPKITVPTAPHL